MPTPIAELYGSQRLSVATSNPSTPPALSRFLSNSQSSTSATGRASRSTHRTSVSIKPEDDPFAPPSPVDARRDREEKQRQTGKEEDNGWGRISEERPWQEATDGGSMRGIVSTVSVGQPGQDSDEQENRRPSFFKSLFSRSRGSSGSVRRSRSTNTLSAAAISPPILSVDTPGPRLAPLKSRASLVSFADLTGPLSPSNATTSRASSLRSRPPLAGVFDPPSHAGPARTHSRSNSTSIRIGAHPQRSASVLRRPASAMELFPPTESSKAFAVLGGEPRVTEGNRKAVETLTAISGLVRLFSLRPPSRPNSAMSQASAAPPILPPTAAARPASGLPQQPEVNLPKLASRPDLQPVSSADIAAGTAKLSASPSTARLGQTPVSSSSGTSTSFKALASLYLVAGLPKEPSAWSLASPIMEDDGLGGARTPDHSPGAVQRFWRPEVLGVQLAEDGEGRLTKDVVRSMQSKAIKLAFDRDVEVIASTTQPPSTTSTFSFSVSEPSVSGLATPTLASPTRFQTFSSSRSSSSVASSSSVPTTYHCVSILVWSHADASRTSAIRSTLVQGQRAKAAALQQAAKTVKAGRKLGQKLERQMKSALGAVPEGGTLLGGGIGSETEAETEGQFTESEWETVASSSAPLAALPPPSIPFWLPYSLILISPFPLYNLLRDYLALSWARYHQDIASHALQMERVLSATAPRAGEEVRLPVSVGEKQSNTFFVATMPGGFDWATGTSPFPVWPIFQALHADNLLTIAELALAPLGRIVFLSRHQLMLSLATLTFQAILEPRGWRGLVHSTAHARDLRIFVDDPGPFLIGVPFSSRSLALSTLAPEIVIVDLDNNSVTCSKPAPGALSTGALRDKARKKLEAAIGDLGGQHGVPIELEETFPDGRFRPFCKVEVAGQAREAERLKPHWEWDEALVLTKFDSILSELPQTGLARLFRPKKPRKVAELDKNALRVQSIVRKQASSFVDRRDLLEAKVNKANQRLAFLTQETAEWQRSIETFRAFSDKITKESAKLKTRLERERREARRLSGQVLAEKERHGRLEASLADVEKAREQAIQQLSTVDAVRQELEQQRSLLLHEINTILSSAEDETSPLVQSVFAAVESISHRSDSPSFSRPSTSLSLRSSSRIARSPSLLSRRIPDHAEENLVAEGDSLPSIYEGDEDLRLEAMKLAVQETVRSISSRLSIGLQTAGQVCNPGQVHLAASASSGSLTSKASFTALPPSVHASSIASSLSSSTRPPPSPDIGPFHSPSSPASPGSHGFQLKPLTLGTPPVSPENRPPSPVAFTPSSFVTVRPAHRRVPSARSNDSTSFVHHVQHESAASLASFRSFESSSSVSSTPTSASLAHTIVRQAQHAAGLVRSASYASSIRSKRRNLQRSTSTTSQISDYSTTDYESDAHSFVSASEGGAHPGGSGVGGDGGRPLSRATEGGKQDAFDLEELAWTMNHQQQEQLDAACQRDDENLPSPFATSLSRNRSSSNASSTSTASYQRMEPGKRHSRADSGTVALFTRSLRGRRGGSMGGSLDLRERVGSPVEANVVWKDRGGGEVGSL
ncbi:hypothetical protein JCM11251_004256 [Rhodosporidiobolus azoricus]